MTIVREMRSHLMIHRENRAKEFLHELCVHLLQWRSHWVLESFLAMWICKRSPLISITVHRLPKLLLDEQVQVSRRWIVNWYLFWGCRSYHKYQSSLWLWPVRHLSRLTAWTGVEHTGNVLWFEYILKCMTTNWLIATPCQSSLWNWTVSCSFNLQRN